jgi:hypothetical protein
MTITPRHVDLALDVRRGLVRLRELPPEDAPAVTAVLRRTTDAQFAQMAESKQYVTPRASRCTPRPTWRARSH